MITVALTNGSMHKLKPEVGPIYLVREMERGGLIPTSVDGVLVAVDHIVSVVVTK